MCLSQRLQDTVVEFALVEAGGGFGVDCDFHLARHVGQIGDDIPGREKLVAVGGE